MSALGNFLEDQWLRLRAPIAGGAGLIPGWGTKIPTRQEVWSKRKNLKEKKEMSTLILK